MSWYISALKNYAKFDGRARRTEYWMYTLFYFLTIAAAGILAAIGFGVAKPLGVVFIVLIVLFFLGTIVPTLAVTVRRLHDTGRSGGWYFISFVPYVGGLILLVLCCLDSQPDNQYGPNPKGLGGPTVPDLPWPQAPFGPQ